MFNHTGSGRILICHYDKLHTDYTGLWRSCVLHQPWFSCSITGVHLCWKQQCLVGVWLFFFPSNDHLIYHSHSSASNHIFIVFVLSLIIVYRVISVSTTTQILGLPTWTINSDYCKLQSHDTQPKDWTNIHTGLNLVMPALKQKVMKLYALKIHGPLGWCDRQ